jgi:hypothetical protein
MPDASYAPKVYMKQGGDTQVVASGGAIDIESGGAIKAAGTQASAIVSLTDSTTGTAGNTVDDTTASVKDDIASLAAKINAILAALRGAGIIVT